MSEGSAGERQGSHAADPPKDTVLAISFVASAGKQMLESSTSVSEVEERLRQFLPAVGLEGCSLDSTLSSIVVSYWEPGQPVPITVMRDLTVSDPHLERLSGAEALLDEVERGDIDLQEASERLRTLARSPGVRRRAANAAILASVAGWVLFLDGLTVLTVLVALLATLLTFPVDALIRRLALPSVTETFVVAVILAAVPNLLAAAGVSLRVGPAVVGALYIYLPGRALVSSVIDGLANAPLSSISRGLQALVVAGALALGMLVGSKLGTGLGLDYSPDLTATPLLLSVSAAVLAMLGLAVAWSMPRERLIPTVAIGAGAWLLLSLTATVGDAADWPLYCLAAGLVGLAGTTAALLQGASASVYTGVAILPLVPGFTLYTAVLALSQGRQTQAVDSFGDAGVISLAIAVGLAVGLALARIFTEIGGRVAPQSGRFLPWR